jgi:hypothetical protein
MERKAQNRYLGKKEEARRGLLRKITGSHLGSPQNRHGRRSGKDAAIFPR